MLGSHTDTIWSTDIQVNFWRQLKNGASSQVEHCHRFPWKNAIWWCILVWWDVLGSHMDTIRPTNIQVNFRSQVRDVVVSVGKHHHLKFWWKRTNVQDVESIGTHILQGDLTKEIRSK